MRKTILLALSLLVMAAACGGEQQIGAGVDEPKDIRTVTPSPTPAQARPNQATPPPQQPRPTPPPAATPVPQETTFNLAIDPSKQGGFDPPQFNVYAGTVIVVTNKDSKDAHSWVAENGAFDSGPIPPGGTYRYTANQPGEYPFKDGLAPYFFGKMTVLSQ